MKITKLLVLQFALLVMLTSSLRAQSSQRTYGRLIWQDASESKLCWGDLKRGSAWSLKVESVPGQPEIDSEQQMFVQMQAVDDVALVAIRDHDDGNFSSGWMAIKPGVTKEAHGDHYHWHFDSVPKVVASKMDEHQGNPAHVYLYDGKFYVANDKKNGFTVIEPSLAAKASPGADRFFEAGGGHVTMAAVKGKVAYSTWIDRDGDNKGRVDVVGLGSNAGRGYSFQLPSGGIHGATASSGKVFFAPSDGICWVSADETLTTSDKVAVNHISLGETEDGMPIRTGAFAQSGSHVLFTVTGSAGPELCTINAGSAKPRISKLGITVADGNKLTTPKTVQTSSGAPLALMFEESPDGDQTEKLHIVALDPNRDRQFDDAKHHKSIVVGRSLIEGHSGHHELAQISRRFIAISNPGDGTISIISTSTWETQSTLSVGGTPTRIVAFGG